MNRPASFLILSVLAAITITSLLPARGGTAVAREKNPRPDPIIAAKASPPAPVTTPGALAVAPAKVAPPLASAATPLPVAAPAPEKPAAPTSWEDQFDALLKKYTSPAGVRYAAWKNDAADVTRLRKVVDAIASGNLAGKTRDQELAFYLNAYNAWILQKIIDAYPVKGPGNGSAIKRAYFFKNKSIEVAGAQTSFSALENDIIRPRFKEPRIHFALNCASASCPPLQLKAFRPADLERDLDTLARNFVSGNPRGVQLEPGGRKVLLSKIFDWYGDDFKAVGGLIPYINRFRATPIPASAKISFMDYDWSLNEQR